MIYLVSVNRELFNHSLYDVISLTEALNILEPLKLVQFDTETKGLDCWTKEILTIQLGNKENQVVIDWNTLSKEEKLKLKNYLEGERTLLGWNLSKWQLL